MKTKNNTLLSLGFIALALASNVAHAAIYTWNTNTSGALWSDPNSWVDVAVPTFVAGDTFDLSTLNIAAATTSSMDTIGGNTLGTIKIGDTNSTHSWTLALTTALTLDGNGSAAAINQVSTSKGDTINGAGGIILASNLDTTNASSVSANILQISTGITATGATRTITNSGTGVARVNLNNAIGSGINLVQNSTTSALWMLAASASFDGTITVKAGSFEVGATTGGAISLGTAAFTLGDTSGSSDATLVLKSINGSGYSAPISVASGSTGIKSIFGAVNSGNNTNVLSSAITLGASSSATADFTIGNSTASTSTYQVRSAITGFGNVTIKTLSSGRTQFSLGSINNTGTLTNAGTGTGVAQIDEVIGTNVTGVVQNSSTSRMNLNAANTYTGDTTVTAGVLGVNGTAIADANKLVIDGGQVNATGTEVVGTLFFGAVQKASGTWGSSLAVPTPDHVDDVHFTGTGVVSVTTGPASGYSTWATTNVGGQTPSDDYNNDGVDNGIAYFMNNTGIISLPGIVGGAVTWTNGGNIPTSAYDTQYRVQTSPDLVNWTPVASGGLTTNTAGPGGSLTYTLPTGQGKFFVRLTVTPQ